MQALVKLYALVFAFFLLINLPFALWAGKRVANAAVAWSAAAPMLLILALCYYSVLSFGFAKTFQDAKLLLLIVQIGLPLAILAALAAKAAHLATRLIRRRGLAMKSANHPI